MRLGAAMTAVPRVVASTTSLDLSIQRSTEFSWRRIYPIAATGTDVAAAGLVLAVAHLTVPATQAPGVVGIPLLVALWIGSLALVGGYRGGADETGASQLRRVLEAAACFAGVLSTLLLLTDGRASRSAFLATIVAVPLLSAVGRGVLRAFALRAWAEGRGMRRVVVAGEEALVQQAVKSLVESGRYRGTKVVAACVPTPGQRFDLLSAGVPVLGGLGSVERAVELTDADAVVVVPSPALSGLELRRLAWRLADARIDLVIAPPLESVTSDRLAVVDLGSVVGVRVLRPRTGGPLVALQDLGHRVLALAGLVALSPLLLLMAAAVCLDSKGPAIYRQTRCGRDGQPFTLYKFRTMTVDADARRTELATLNESDGPLFKLRNDPRVTRVGRLLRRTSLDELPQLFNVVLGQMLLVGPRPPLPAEVAQYDQDTKRRLVVKPGITGLWQVSGRSDLSWRESVALDLRYVDNRTLPGDLAILWRTVRAVTNGTGAY